MSLVKSKVICTHCGDECHPNEVVRNEENSFCCTGCSMVYELLQNHEMGKYYQLETTPGVKLSSTHRKDWSFLDDEGVKQQLINFNDGSIAKITFTLPQIHCSSCLWLLERLDRIQEGIISSKVDFLSKRARILFDTNVTSLRSIVTLLSNIGYEPELNLGKLDESSSKKHVDRSLLYKIGLTGFAFGNIMLLSFPEYLGLQTGKISAHIGYINIALALPVVFYSGGGYIQSAITSLRHRMLNIDVPIALGITTLFLRSVYDIITLTGEGYLDSLAGLVFFLLIGKWFQNFTYKSLDFDRNYKSYFPISTLVKHNNKVSSVSLAQLSVGDHIVVKNEELIPTDSILLKGKGKIDYSFVTGESDSIHKEEGDLIYAGGKQKGGSIELEIVKRVDQSYLTELWNEDVFKESKPSTSTHLMSVISKYFTLTILLIAFVTFLFWVQYNMSLAVNSFTAVLIVACPCALALSIPFTYGNILRILSRDGFFLRNVSTIEKIQDIDHIVFDKTGTLTNHNKLKMNFSGKPLSQLEQQLIKSMTNQSTHPLSRAIEQLYPGLSILKVIDYNEVPGKGLTGFIDGVKVQVGSLKHIFGEGITEDQKGVFVSLDNSYRGKYEYKDEFREGVPNMVKQLGKSYKISVISGDSHEDESRVRQLMNSSAKILFNKSPLDKLKFIKHLQGKNEKVMMIGDGLNDAGALKQSDIGMVITDNANNFTPSSDAILSANHFKDLVPLLEFIQKGRWMIYGALALALLYNIVGLYYATTGQLSPVIAAILMPLSSITIIIYGIGISHFTQRVMLKNESLK